MKRTTKLLLVVTVSLLAVGLATASVTAFGSAADVQTQDSPENVAVTLDGDATSLELANDEPVDDGGAGDDDGGGGGGELEP